MLKVKFGWPGTALSSRPSDTELLRNRPLLCLSHLRWDLVFQRPQHLMTRFARHMRVYFVEEPAFEGDDPPSLVRYEPARNVTVLVPHLPATMSYHDAVRHQKALLQGFCKGADMTAPVLWFYTPEALRYADALPAAVTVYDCMDELSAFQGPRPSCELEAALLERADLVFTGGISLYEAKRERHRNVHVSRARRCGAFPPRARSAARARRSGPHPTSSARIFWGYR